MPATTDPDRLAELEEERRFLLRSLADLEREYEAGDIDDVDYRELRDGYTVRAAATLRAIEEGRAALPDRPPVNWRRRLITVAVVVGLVAVVGWALAASSAQRLPGQQITGLDPRSERQQLVTQARMLQFSDPLEAARLYGLVLDGEPDDVEALTYRGWTLALSTVNEADRELVTDRLLESVELLARATEVDPDYPDPQCFLGIIQFRFLELPEAAAPYVDACLAADPPADVRSLVESLSVDVGAALDSTGP